MENLCPICNKENQCGVKNRDEACWCTQYIFPEVDKNTLQLPNVCICQTCAQKLGAVHKLTTKK